MNIDKIIYTLSIYSSIIFFLLCTIIFFKTSSAFDCNNLIVEGCIITNEKNILDKASNYRGISVFDIDINSLEKDILPNLHSPTTERAALPYQSIHSAQNHKPCH